MIPRTARPRSIVAKLRSYRQRVVKSYLVAVLVVPPAITFARKGESIYGGGKFHSRPPVDNESDRTGEGCEARVRSISDSIQLVSTPENLLAPRRTFGVLVIRAQLDTLLGGALPPFLQGRINSGLACG